MTSVTSVDNEATEVTNDSTMEDESFTTNDFHPDEGGELQKNCGKASSMGFVNMVSSKKYYADAFSENKAFHELMHKLNRRYLRLQQQPADINKCFTTCN
ncbi:hypothetical protein QTP88_019052 [Uroleucon formosanum]